MRDSEFSRCPEAYVRTIMAGAVARKRYDGNEETGAGADHVLIEKCLEKMSLQGRPLDRESLYAETVVLVEEHWPAIEKVAALLLQRGRLKGPAGGEMRPNLRRERRSLEPRVAPPQGTGRNRRQRAFSE
jgi:hypothetical protein